MSKLRPTIDSMMRMRYLCTLDGSRHTHLALVELKQTKKECSAKNNAILLAQKLLFILDFLIDVLLFSV